MAYVEKSAGRLIKATNTINFRQWYFKISNYDKMYNSDM